MQGMEQFLPGLQQFKIYPQDLAGLVGQPVVNKVIYVDGNAGSDTANDGSSYTNALATYGAAITAANSFDYNVIIIAPSANSSTAVAAATTFSKSYITTIGAPAPSINSPRARISISTTSGSLTMSGMGNRFLNVQLACFQNVNVPFTLSGDRNYFGGVHFAGIGDNTAASAAAARSLQISGGDENVFDSCEFGVTTIARDAANAQVGFDTAASRNKFRNCYFMSMADDTDPVMVKTTGDGIGSITTFEDCVWYNFSPNQAAGGNLAAAFDLTSMASSGEVILKGDEFIVGITDWSAATDERIWMNRATATANVLGIPLNPATS